MIRTAMEKGFSLLQKRGSSQQNSFLREGGNIASSFRVSVFSSGSPQVHKKGHGRFRAHRTKVQLPGEDLQRSLDISTQSSTKKERTIGLFVSKLRTGLIDEV